MFSIFTVTLSLFIAYAILITFLLNSFLLIFRWRISTRGSDYSKARLEINYTSGRFLHQTPSLSSLHLHQRPLFILGTPDWDTHLFLFCNPLFQNSCCLFLLHRKKKPFVLIVSVIKATNFYFIQTLYLPHNLLNTCIPMFGPLLSFLSIISSITLSLLTISPDTLSFIHSNKSLKLKKISFSSRPWLKNTLTKPSETYTLTMEASMLLFGPFYPHMGSLISYPRLTLRNTMA